MKNKEIIKFMIKYINKDKKLFILGFVFSLLGALLAVTFGYLMGEATQSAIDSNFSRAIIILIIYLMTAFLDNLVFRRKSRIYLAKLSNNIMERISADVFEKVSLLPSVAFEEKTSGEYINRVTNDSATISNTIEHFVNVAVYLMSTIFVFIYILFNSWIITLEIILYTIFMVILTKKYTPMIKKLQKEITEEKDKSIAEVNEIVRGIREVKALGIKDKLVLSVKDIINTIFSKSTNQMKNEINYNSVTHSLSSLLEVTVFITSIMLVFLEMADFGFFMAMSYYVYRFMGVSEWIMQFVIAYQKMGVAVNRVDEITENRLYQDENFGDLNKIDIDGLIKFNDVTFKYSNEEKNIFNKLNLEIKPNMVTAIVGKSGQGKSSIFNLILRYFDVNDGSVTIDSVDVREFNEYSFRKNIAVIRQEPFLFNKSILSNLKIIDENKSLNDIRKVCKKAQIDDYIMTLPNKYDTIIGEGGVNLSGGQKQRLAIARALLKESKIILFDEATSALDNTNQEKIKKVIGDLSKDHTIVVIAHRLTTIENADVIHVVDNGKIIDSGKHKKLIKSSSIYKELYKEEK